MAAKQDLTNKRFGKLVALEVRKVGSKRCWLCKCDCGNEVVVPTFCLNSGNNTSCGCGRYGMSIGDVFGDLTLIEIVEYRKYGKGNRLVVKCKCKCGGEKTLFSRNLTNGRADHCGCKTFERLSKASRKEYGVGVRNSVINAYKYGAKNRNYSFELTNEETINLFSGDCYYCGEKPSRVVKVKKMYGEFVCNGIDRLDPSKGYELGNVVSCCTTCNYLKGTYTEKDFLTLIHKIANNCPVQKVRLT